MNIHHVRVGVEIDVPNLLGDQLAGQYFAFSPRQERQQLKLRRRKLQTPAAARCLVVKKVDFKVCQLQSLRLASHSPPQDRMDSCQQLREGKRLYQVIVRAEFQSLDPMAHGVTGGEKKNRSLLARAAEL